MFASRPWRPEPSSMTHVTRGLQRRSGMKIGWSTQQIMGIGSNNPPNRKRRNYSDDLLMLRSGTRSIIQQGKIWRNAKLFWIVRRCLRSQWCRSHDEEIITELIPTMMTSLTRLIRSSRVAYPSPRRYGERSSRERERDQPGLAHQAGKKNEVV
jgi:hypothetical protein